MCCLHEHDKAELAATGLMTASNVDIYTACCHFHELKCKGKVEIISGRRKCYALRGLILQVMVKVTILADCPGTREVHFNTGSRPNSRVPEYPLRTLVYAMKTSVLRFAFHKEQQEIAC